MSYHQDDHQHSTGHFVASQADTYDTAPYSNRNLNYHSSFYFSVELPNEIRLSSMLYFIVTRGAESSKAISKAGSLCIYGIESNFLVF